jgi:hypothetical protein
MEDTMRYPVLATAIVGVAFTVAGCDDPTPTEATPALSGPQHAVTVNEKDLPFGPATLFPNPVCGDEVTAVGTDHWVEKYTETPNGRILISWRTNYTGTATGSPSGHTWKMSGQWGGQATVDADGFPYVESDVNSYNLIGQGNVPNIVFKARYQLTINAPGDIVVDRLVIDAKCLGA